VAEHGIIWESGGVPGKGPIHWGSIAIFETREAREAAIRWLREGFGFSYFTAFKDVQGFGLSWADKIRYEYTTPEAARKRRKDREWARNFRPGGRS
jgi:hypothetical protein